MKKDSLNNISLILLIILTAGLIVHIAYNSQIYGSDPGKIFNRAKVFLDYGYQESFKMLLPPSTIILYSVFLGIFDYSYPLLLIQGISWILLALLIYRFVNYHMHNQLVAIISIILLLYSETLISMVYWLPAYTTSLFLTTLGISLFLKYTNEKRKKSLYLSSIFMVSAAYFHNLFLIAGLIPLIYYILHENKMLLNIRHLNPLTEYYIIYGILYLPWFLYGFSIAGFDFYKAPYTWMQIKYWPEFNLELFNRPAIHSIDYFQYFIDNSDELIPFYLILPFILIGFLKSDRKYIYISWILVSISPVLLGIISTNMRYLILSVPAIILLACEGLVYTYKTFSRKSFTLIFSIFIIFGASAIDMHLGLYHQRQSINYNQIIQFENFKDYINDGENIYFRSHIIQPFFPKNRVYETAELDEEDAINFLVWSSNETSRDIMMKYNIKWVLLYNPKEEKRLHSWLNLINQEPKHYLMIENSPYLTKRQQTKNYILYEVTP